MITATPMSSVRPVPGQGEQPSWIYLCGGHATEESSMAEAQQVGLKNKSGIVYWHDTKVEDVIAGDEKAHERQSQLVSQVVALIKKTLPTSRGSLTLIGHSYGALLIQKALSQLPAEERGSLDVVTLGGASMVPKRLAKSARNYVDLTHDLIAEGAQHFFDATYMLDRVKRIYHQIKNAHGAITVRKALLEVFAREEQNRLDPMNGVTRDSDLYRQLFIFGNRDGFDKRWVAERLTRWVAPIVSHNIYPMEGDTPSEHPLGFGEDLNVDDKLCDEAIQEMIALGKRSLASHVVSAFAKVPFD